MTPRRFLGEARKAVAAFTAGIAVMVAAGITTGNLAVWLTGAAAAVTAALNTYLSPPNDPPASKVEVIDHGAQTDLGTGTV
jgi:hypothetical protein